MVPEAMKQGSDWGKEHGQPFTEHEFAVLQELSAAIDEHWDSVAIELHNQRAGYEAMLPKVWPAKPMSGQDRTHRPSEFPDNYRRIKLALDYWCSLWFWPISEYGLLPPRHQFLLEMSLILTGRPAATEGTLSWVLETELEEVEANAVRTLLDDSDNQLDVSDLAGYMSGRLRVVEDTTAEQHFLHWPLEFGDILSRRSGFDLIVGNPPWVQMHWTEKEFLAQYTPSIVLRTWSADRIARQRASILDRQFFNGFVVDARMGSARAAFNSHRINFPLLQGKPNTYKIFISQCFGLNALSGSIGLIHPIVHLLDPKGRQFRETCYRRLALLLQFTNARKRNLFSDIESKASFAICIYRGIMGPIHFRMMANLFAPETANESLIHDSLGPVPGIKDANGRLQLRGHGSRIIDVDETVLTNLGTILDPSDPPSTCRLPMLHSRELVTSLVKITSQPRRLGDLKEEYLQDLMWDETGSMKTDPPVFKRETAFRTLPKDLILTGPIVGLANPLAKCPIRSSRHNSDYEDIDLGLVPDDYLPRSNYVSALPWNIYRNLVRSVPWDRSVKHIDCPRIVLREYVNPSNERSLQCCLIGSGIAHVHVCESVAFKDWRYLIEVCTLWNALPYDFITKSFQITHMRTSFTSQLPLVELPSTACHRMLQLNCLTIHHATIWNDLASNYVQLDWSAVHPGLELENPMAATHTWSRDCALRTDLARRQALVEVDVLVAMALGLTLDELIQIYRLVFPTLQSYEENTWYDQRGRIVWSRRHGKGMSMPRTEWERQRNMKRGHLTEDVTFDFLPDGPHDYTIEYEAPFTRPDREMDYRVAWEYFEKELDIPRLSNQICQYPSRL